MEAGVKVAAFDIFAVNYVFLRTKIRVFIEKSKFINSKFKMKHRKARN